MDTSKNRKRKGTPSFKIPLGYVREEVDDNEGADTFLQCGSDIKPKIKKESSDSISSSELVTLYNKDTIPYSPYTAPSSKRSRLNLSGRCSTQPRTPVKDGNQIGSANATNPRACSVSSQSAIPSYPLSLPLSAEMHHMKIESPITAAAMDKKGISLLPFPLLPPSPPKTAQESNANMTKATKAIKRKGLCVEKNM